MKEAYTDLVIIGNGFDLNLGLKTSYHDFMISDEFNEQTGSQFALYLKNKKKFLGPKNWVDIEKELIVFSEHIIKKEVQDVDFESEFNMLSNSLIKYLQTITYDNLDENSWAYSLLELVKDTNFYIVDFNYTKTVYRILINLGLKSQDINERLHKIHGSINQNKIIFGVDDKAKIPPEHIFIKKGFNEHYNPINFDDVFRSCKNIHFFGHSLGETDHMYFRRIFRDLSIYGKDKKRVNFYYYGKNGYRDQLIQVDYLTSNSLSVLRRNHDFIPINTEMPN